MAPKVGADDVVVPDPNPNPPVLAAGPPKPKLAVPAEVVVGTPKLSPVVAVVAVGTPKEKDEGWDVVCPPKLNPVPAPVVPRPPPKDVDAEVVAVPPNNEGCEVVPKLNAILVSRAWQLELYPLLNSWVVIVPSWFYLHRQY